MRTGQARKGAGILLIVIGLCLLTVISVYLLKDISIWILGRRNEAQVVAAWAEEVSGEGSTPYFRYFVRYQFATPHGETVTGISAVAAQEWAGLGMGGPVNAVYQEQANVPQYGVGGIDSGHRVTVVYFPLYPAHNRLDDTRLVPVLACAYVPLLLLGWAVLAGGRHLIRQT